MTSKIFQECNQGWDLSAGRACTWPGSQASSRKTLVERVPRVDWSSILLARRMPPLQGWASPRALRAGGLTGRTVSAPARACRLTTQMLSLVSLLEEGWTDRCSSTGPWRTIREAHELARWMMGGPRDLRTPLARDQLPGESHPARQQTPADAPSPGRLRHGSWHRLPVRLPELARQSRRSPCLRDSHLRQVQGVSVSLVELAP